MPEPHTHQFDWDDPYRKHDEPHCECGLALTDYIASLESRLALYEKLETAAKLLDDALTSMRGGEVSPAVRNMHKVLREAVAELEARKDPRRVEV